MLSMRGNKRHNNGLDGWLFCENMNDQDRRKNYFDGIELMAFTKFMPFLCCAYNYDCRSF